MHGLVDSRTRPIQARRGQSVCFPGVRFLGRSLRATRVDLQFAAPGHFGQISSARSRAGYGGSERGKSWRVTKPTMIEPDFPLVSLSNAIGTFMALRDFIVSGLYRLSLALIAIGGVARERLRRAVLAFRVGRRRRLDVPQNYTVRTAKFFPRHFVADTASEHRRAETRSHRQRGPAFRMRARKTQNKGAALAGFRIEELKTASESNCRRPLRGSVGDARTVEFGAQISEVTLPARIVGDHREKAAQNLVVVGCNIKRVHDKTWIAVWVGATAPFGITADIGGRPDRRSPSDGPPSLGRQPRSAGCALAPAHWPYVTVRQTAWKIHATPSRTTSVVIGLLVKNAKRLMAIMHRRAVPRRSQHQNKNKLDMRFTRAVGPAVIAAMPFLLTVRRQLRYTVVIFPALAGAVS